jgi:uncharacterized protein (TIGR02996 family)
MVNENRFLRQVDEHPDDLAALLVYADWLDDQGDEVRAGFLRLQQEVLRLRHYRPGGFRPKSAALLKLGRALDPAWLAVVSRPRLAGTCWSGTDSLDGWDIWRFLPGGVLNYTSGSGTYQNATWVQVGNHVAMETNDHYADYEGFVGGDLLRGTAHNITGLKWTWKARRTTDPQECELPDDPDTTVYPHPPKEEDLVRPARRRRPRSSGR